METRQLIICRGIQGSGKSTWAKQWCHEDPEHRIRFNNDDIRNMLGDYWVPNREKVVTATYNTVLAYGMEKGYNIVVDNMNLNPKTCAELEKMVRDFNENYTYDWKYEVEYKDPEYLKTVITLVNECRGVEENKVRYQIPTLHGYHLITIGFDVQQFSQKLAIKNMDPIDIQKDNPTLLYYATV